jgi:hypothetical protein
VSTEVCARINDTWIPQKHPASFDLAFVDLMCMKVVALSTNKSLRPGYALQHLESQSFTQVRNHPATADGNLIVNYSHLSTLIKGHLKAPQSYSSVAVIATLDDC